MPNRIAALSSLLLLGALAAAPAHASVSRTFVASTGADSNTAVNCGPTAPCRTFNAALSVTSVGGEVVVLDSAGYGPAPITITQAVSIIAPAGVYAGVSVPTSTNGIVVNAPSNATVILRGLTLNGQGTANGVVITAGASVTVDHCLINGFSSGSLATPVTGAGIYVKGVASVDVVDTTVSNSYYGIWIDANTNVAIERTQILGSRFLGILLMPTTSNTTESVFVADSRVSHSAFAGILAYGNYSGFSATGNTATMQVIHTEVVSSATYGIGADGGATLTAAQNIVVGNNGPGWLNPGGTFDSVGNNTLIGNVSPSSGTITATPADATY
jgi:nitrous oxidase accessory protein NosD